MSSSANRFSVAELLADLPSADSAIIKKISVVIIT
jgi:hypothetical protein